jgi:hypothetical protein
LRAAAAGTLVRMMKPEALAMAEARVPRYTSYPTAPHFKPQIDEARVQSWLGQIDATKPVSLYLHVPFCGKLCWYCGCNTSIANKYVSLRRGPPVRGERDVGISELLWAR